MEGFDFGIKAKTPKHRQTLAKRIKTLATKDTCSAISLAEIGEKLSLDEQQIKLFIKEFKIMKDENRIPTAAIVPALSAVITRSLEKSVRAARLRFANQLVAAIENLDYETFFFFGNTIKKIKHAGQRGDQMRANILGLKRVSELTHTSLTVREIANLLEWPASDGENGFPQLRRLCKELGYPLAASRQTRRK